MPGARGPVSPQCARPVPVPERVFGSAIPGRRTGIVELAVAASVTGSRVTFSPFTAESSILVAHVRWLRLRTWHAGESIPFNSESRKQFLYRWSYCARAIAFSCIPSTLDLLYRMWLQEHECIKSNTRLQRPVQLTETNALPDGVCPWMLFSSPP